MTTAMKNQPTAPSRADGASGDFPFHDPRIRAQGRAMLLDAIHAHEDAARRLDEVTRDFHRIAQDDEERARIYPWFNLAALEADEARTKVALVLLVLWGDIGPYDDDGVKATDKLEVPWRARGACVGDRLVVVAPGTDAKEAIIYELDCALVTVLDLADVADLGCILAPDPARKTGNPE